jgi:N-acetylmuramoyl-L-alanine amidase
LRGIGAALIIASSDRGHLKHTRVAVRCGLAAAAFALPLLAHASTDPVVVLSGKDRREIQTVTRGMAELVPLSQLVIGTGIAVTPDPRAAAVTLAYQGRSVTLYDKKSLAQVGGELRLLSSNVVHEQGQWLVPVDSAPRLLGPLLAKRAEWRPARRVLLIGDVAVPQITVATSVSGDAVRVTLQSTEKLPYKVQQEAGRVTVAVARDVVDVAHQPERLTGGIVDNVQFAGGHDNTFAIGLGRRFKTLQTFELEDPPRLVLEFQAAPIAAEEAGASPSPPPVPHAEGSTAIRTVIIDPGHGGTDVGASGPSGTFEKDITLNIARKVRANVANGLGLQAYLTRDRDQEVALEDRPAFANNYKADLFVSIHANAFRSEGARGSEVYFLSYQASDDESQRLATNEGGGIAPPTTAAPAGSDLALILWDMAQAEHLEESSSLASRIQEELAEVTGSQSRGVKQAPFRVLVGAAMPAVLVEVAFISNAAEEKLLASDDYQSRIAAAITRGIARYQREREQRTGADPADSRPKS